MSITNSDSGRNMCHLNILPCIANWKLDSIQVDLMFFPAVFCFFEEYWWCETVVQGFDYLPSVLDTLEIDPRSAAKSCLQLIKFAGTWFGSTGNSSRFSALAGTWVAVLLQEHASRLSSSFFWLEITDSWPMFDKLHTVNNLNSFGISRMLFICLGRLAAWCSLFLRAGQFFPGKSALLLLHFLGTCYKFLLNGWLNIRSNIGCCPGC